MLLWCSAAKQGFQDSRWLTYRQAQELGAQVRKGEGGTTAIFYKTLEKETDDGEIEKVPMLKSFKVFDVEQIDGLAESYVASWLKALKGDKRYIFRAASAASKAHRYLMDC